MRYVPYGELDGIPSIVVDGAAHPDSLLVLSHWPKSGSPRVLRDDLSAQIAFHYLKHPELHVDVEAVSNNHFDQDGLMSMYALLDPESATERRDRVIDVARMGDFDFFHDRDSARIAWTMAALGTAPDVDDAYELLLGRLPELLAHPERYREHWADEDAHLAASEAGIASGAVTIEERPELDLAIVTVPEDWAPRPAHFFTPVVAQAVHAAAVHQVTDRYRVLYRRGRHYRLQYRYETWVQHTARPPGRIDLRSLAGELSALEPGQASWVFDGVETIAPALHLIGAGDDPESAIAPEDFEARVAQALATGGAAWDPYDD